MLEFRILGPFEVFAGGRPLVLGRRRERVLAAALVLAANRVVSPGRLAEELWAPAAPPPAAASALRVHVSRLRAAFGCDAESLATRPGGYLLRVDRGALDAGCFARLVADAGDRAAKGGHAEAAELLRAALGMWRGPALGDLAELPFATAEAARLEESRLAALERCLEADLACGGHAALIGELEALTTQQPTRERFWALRMLALYRSERQSEALAVYQALRRYLGDELGLEPGGAVQRLERGILCHDPALDLAPAPRRESRVPPAPATAPAEGPPTPEPRVAPMPALLVRAGRLFVGRDEELDRLGALWKEAAAGPERRVALLAGEPGIGKTRLAAELAATLPGEDHLVLAGRCDEDLGVPYQPFVEALRHYVAHAGPAPELGRSAGELGRLVPELAAAARDTGPAMQADPETERYRLFDAVAAWLAALSTERPVLLVLDDLHWATKPTVLMLRHILRFGAPMRLLVVVTYRDTDVVRGHPVADWTADLHRETGVERFPLSGLDLAGVVAFIEAAGNPQAAERPDGEEERQAIARAVWAETDGNPFFIAEVLRHLAEAGLVERRGDLWFATVGVGELGIPEGVREVIGRRLSRLSPSANRVLSVAAVAGAEFEPAVVGRAGSVEDEDLFDALEEALAARLLTEFGPRYGFSHALVRATLYDSMGSARRNALHSRVAEAIEDVHAGALDDHLPALAHHWAQSDPKRAVEYAAGAGHRAMVQLAHDEAARFYPQALDLLDDPQDGRHLPLGVCLGEAQRRAGDPTHRQTLLAAADLARERGDPGALVRAALATARGPHFASLLLDPERVAVLEAALPFLPESDVGARARLLASLAAELHWDPDERRRAALSDEALALARRAGDAATLAHVLLARPHAILSPATREERLSVTAELLDLVERLDEPVVRGWAHGIRYRTLVELPEMDQADVHLAAFAEAAEALEHPAMQWVLRCNWISRHTLAGRLTQAADEAAATLEFGRRIGQVDADIAFGVQRYLISLHRGLRPADSLGSVHLAGAYSSRFPATGGWLASAQAELGRLEEARATIAVAARSRFRLPLDQTWIVGMTQFAGAVAAVGDVASAAVIYPVLLPYRTHHAVSGVASGGIVEHWLGLLAALTRRDALADEHFAAAVGAHERFAPVYSARSRLEWGQALLERPGGDDLQARALLNQALGSARELGLGTIERRASALLASRTPCEGRGSGVPLR